MQKNGILSISAGVSRLSDGIRLAIANVGNPLRAATSFLRGKGFDTGSHLTVTGNSGSLGNVPVFFITNAVAALGVMAAADSMNFNGATTDSDVPKPKRRRSAVSSGSSKKTSTKSSSGSGSRKRKKDGEQSKKEPAKTEK
jgi:hypothetical protein